jgi:hypothetical protein
MLRSPHPKTSKKEQGRAVKEGGRNKLTLLASLPQKKVLSFM